MTNIQAKQGTETIKKYLQWEVSGQQKKRRKVSIVQEEVILELLMNETVHVAKEDSGSR